MLAQRRPLSTFWRLALALAFIACLVSIISCQASNTVAKNGTIPQKSDDGQPIKDLDKPISIKQKTKIRKPNPRATEDDKKAVLNEFHKDLTSHVDLKKKLRNIERAGLQNSDYLDPFWEADKDSRAKFNPCQLRGYFQVMVKPTDRPEPGQIVPISAIMVMPDMKLWCSLLMIIGFWMAIWGGGKLRPACAFCTILGLPLAELEVQLWKYRFLVREPLPMTKVYFAAMMGLTSAASCLISVTTGMPGASALASSVLVYSWVGWWPDYYRAEELAGFLMTAVSSSMAIGVSLCRTILPMQLAVVGVFFFYFGLDFFLNCGFFRGVLCTFTYQVIMCNDRIVSREYLAPYYRVIMFASYFIAVYMAYYVHWGYAERIPMRRIILSDEEMAKRYPKRKVKLVGKK